MITEFVLTDHARKRMAQRNVSEVDILFILQHGHVTHCAGTIMVACRHKDIPEERLILDQFRRLDGVSIVMNRLEPLVITVWRNRKRGSRHIRRKRKNGR